MNNLSFFLGPALLGLVAGISHGIVSHYADLPLALTEQFVAPLSASPFPD